jgi:hypothetical protein
VCRFKRRCLRRRDAEAPVRTDANVSVPVAGNLFRVGAVWGGARSDMCTTVAIEISAAAGIVCIEGNRGVIVQQRVGRRGSAVEIVEESLLGTLQTAPSSAAART